MDRQGKSDGKSKTEQRPGGIEEEAIADPLVEATEYDGLF